MSSRRPRRSAQQWAQIISDYHQSGLNAGDFCEQNNLSRATFNKWLYRQSDAGHASAVSLVKLVPDTRDDSVTVGAMLIELDLGSGVQLRISR